jgi:hypothetical protein
MTSLGTRLLIPFRAKLITKDCRTLGSVFDMIGSFCLHKCSFIDAYVLRSLPIPPMVNLKAIGKIYLPQ